MFLGLIIVVVVVGLIYNYFQKKRGVVDVPGSQITENKIENGDDGNSKYKVVKGDSLWKISEKELGSGYDWVLVAKANGLKDPSFLEVGQELVLPTKTKTQTDSVKLEEDTEYTVLASDSLWKIAVKTYQNGYEWTNIWQANKAQIKNPDILYVGMKIILPANKMVE